MKTIQQDLRSNNLSLDEAILWFRSESSTLETDVCVWRYAPLVVLATQQEEKDLTLEACDADVPCYFLTT